MTIARRAILILALTLAAAGAALSAESDLSAYVGKPDGSYTWSKASQSATRQYTRTLIDMTSQTWQGIAWKHKIEMVEPARCDYPDTAILFITGNFHDGGMESQLARKLASTARCPVAVLYDIPNQPLYGGKSEDSLIAYTFVKYMETGDKSWPLLLPMAKGAVRAMDTVQAFASGVKRFVVCGGSKRGWTTWLTAAVDPGRVKGIMPMVYDNLNLGAQMKHQVESFSGYSEQIADYTELGLQKVLEERQDLSGMVDPWTYRAGLTMPKLIINGSNDPYWPVDALNIYWKDLKGPKSVLYMPNSGHGLLNNDTDGSKLRTLVNSMSSFTRSVAASTPIPAIEWKHNVSKGADKLSITADPRSYTARMWVAHSQTRDFRQSKWETVPMTQTDSGFEARVDLPREGYTAVFGEATTSVAGRALTRCTQMAVLDSKGQVHPSARK